MPLLGVLGGLAAAALVGAVGWPLLHGLPSAWLLHGLLVGLAAAALALATEKRAGSDVRTAGVTLAIVTGGYLCSCLSSIPAVRAGARETAHGASYCLQVADGRGDYRVATTPLDLSSLVMRADVRAVTLQFHGVLVVHGPDGWRTYNWSYRKARWDPLAPRPKADPVGRCVPRRDYAARMSWMPGSRGVDQPRDRFFRLAGRSFLIPKSYRPSASSGGGPVLFLNAVAPDFSPRGRDPTPSEAIETSLEFRDSSWVDDEVTDSKEPVADLESTREFTTATRKLFFDKGPDGQVRTLIRCHEVAQDIRGSCQHRFYADGAMWTFRHSLSDLPRWRTLEIAFQRRVAEFRAAAACCEGGLC